MDFFIRIVNVRKLHFYNFDRGVQTSNPVPDPAVPLPYMYDIATYQPGLSFNLANVSTYGPLANWDCQGANTIRGNGFELGTINDQSKLASVVRLVL